jgi:hypothetical protein
MVNAFLMLAAAGIGFGGSPRAAFAIGAALILLFGLPHQLRFLRRYAGQPKTDIVLAMLFGVGLAIVGVLMSAWAGYGLGYILRLFLKG